MKLSKPSPSIVISIAALVFAMAGTGIAAKSTLIDGAKIKNGSITSAKIRNGAITARKLGRDTIVPKGYALVLVRTGSAKKSSARSSQTSADPDPSIVRNTNGVLPGTNTPFVLPTRCELPGGEIVVYGTTPCPDRTAATQPLNSLVTSIVSQATTPIAQDVQTVKTDLQETAQDFNVRVDSNWNFSGARVTVPAGAVGTQVFAPLSGVAQAGLSFAAAQTATPSVDTNFRNISVKIVRNPVVTNLPLVFEVSLVVNDNAAGAAATCSFNLQTASSCTVPGPVKAPAGATAAWAIKLIGQGTPPNITTWSDFDLSLGYSTSG